VGHGKGGSGLRACAGLDNTSGPPERDDMEGVVRGGSTCERSIGEDGVVWADSRMAETRQDKDKPED